VLTTAALIRARDHGVDVRAPLTGRFRKKGLLTAADEAAGHRAGVLAPLKHCGAGDQGRGIAIGALDQPFAARRQVVHDFRRMQLQPLMIDHVDVGALAGLCAFRLAACDRKRALRYAERAKLFCRRPSRAIV